MEKWDGRSWPGTERMEAMDEELADVLCLVILLENDLEIRDSDGIHARVLEMVQQSVRRIREMLSGTGGPAYGKSENGGYME